jgi:hypothetical protein
LEIFVSFSRKYFTQSTQRRKGHKEKRGNNNTDMSLQLIVDIENFESKNVFEGTKMAIEQIYKNLTLTRRFR